jgi:hypothetical protein
VLRKLAFLGVLKYQTKISQNTVAEYVRTICPIFFPVNFFLGLIYTNNRFGCLGHLALRLALNSDR